MLDYRNHLSPTYSFAEFIKAVDALVSRYLPAMEALHEFFVKENLK